MNVYYSLLITVTLIVILLVNGVKLDGVKIDLSLFVFYNYC